MQLIALSYLWLARPCVALSLCLLSTPPTPSITQAAPALLPRNNGIPPGLPVLITLSSAFGNCLSLPTLYLATMLAGSPLEFARATACVAVFFAAWSPLLWVFGYGRLQRQQREEEMGPAAKRRGSGRGACGAVWFRSTL
jgi:hypothetical protein